MSDFSSLKYLPTANRLATAMLIILLWGCSVPAVMAAILPGKVGAILANGQQNQRQYLVDFAGNKTFSAEQLREIADKELQSLADSGFKKSVVDDAAFQIESFYRQRGYIQARVDYRYKEDSVPRQITFLVSEGPQVEVEGIELNGNNAIEDDRLLNVDQEVGELIKSGRPFPLVESQMQSLADDMRALYLTEGFIDSRIHGPQISYSENGTRAVVSFHIEEGAQYHIGNIIFKGELVDEVRQDLEKLRKESEGQVYFNRRRLLLKSNVVELYEEQGYPEGQVEVRQEKNNDQKLINLQVSISSGNKIRIGNISIQGNERTRTSFIASRLAFKPGELYTLSSRRKSFRSLYQTGLFSTVSIGLSEQESEEAGTERDVVVQVEERMAREIYVEPGWGSYEMLRLAAGFKDRNLFGTGRIFRFDTAVSFKGSTVEFGLTDPWFLATSISADFPINYRYRKEPVFTQEEIGIGALFTKNFAKKVSLTAGYRLSRSNITDVDPDVDQTQIANSYSSAILSLQLTRDTRNDFFFPTEGYRGFASGEIATPVVGSSISFYRLTTGVRYFYQLPAELVLGMRYTTGLVLPMGDQVGIPLGERFFNGGENSVRSFRESQLGPIDRNGDALGGTAYNIISFELRKRLKGNFAGSLFVDIGNIAPNRIKEDGSTPLAASRAELSRATFSEYFRDMRAGIGAGLQYLLPVGPARLDFAVNPSPDKERNEKDYVIHFSIGMAF
jgi:outer membrane protein insertion porin family